jgi:drug/metabolite transporter (DMT)-like permease
LRKWLLYSLLTVLFWGAWGALGKAQGDMSAGQSQAFSTLGIIPVMVAVAAVPGFSEGDRKWRGSLSALLAGGLVGIGNAAYYQAVALAKAATTVSFTALYPVVTVVLALVLLREKPHRMQFAGIVGSLAAIYLLSVGQPGEAFSEWLVYALAAVVLWGVSALLMKIATGDVSAEQSTFWFLAAFIPLGAAILAIQPRMLVPEPIRWVVSGRDWLMVALLGATYGLGNLTLLAAYRNEGKASVVTPLTGLYPAVTIPLAIALLGESVGLREWIGIGLALLAGAALSREQHERPGRSTGNDYQSTL